MISLLSGTVRSIQSDRLVVEVGGFGLSVLVTPGTTSQITLGSQVQLFTSLVVREESLTLYGFVHEEARSLFELLQTVSGIGPKTAKLIVLSLTGKLSLTGSESKPTTTSEANVVAALIGLGYPERLAKKSVEETAESNMSETEILRGALSQLANARRVSNDV